MIDLQTLAWSLAFTGRMVEKTRCTVRDGWAFAREVRENTRHWQHAIPREIADFMIKTRLQTMKQLKTTDEMDVWFAEAKPGECAIYGFANWQSRPTAAMMRRASEYYNLGAVQLFQKRQPDGSFAYLIRKPAK